MAIQVTSAIWQQVNTPALDMRRFVSVGIAEGVLWSGDMVVSQRGAGANLSVDVSAGQALVQGDSIAYQGLYYVLNDATTNVTGFSAADATNPRIDRVALRVRDAFHGDAANDAAFVVLTGTATAGATLANLTGAPAIPNNELLLANVLVPNGATTITTANIDTTVRTLVRPLASALRVTGTVDINNTAAFANVLTMLIPANSLGTQGLLRCTMLGDYLNNAGVNSGFQVRVTYGGTVIYQGTTAVVIPTGTTRRPFKAEILLAAVNSNTVGVVTVKFDMTSLSAAVTGTGNFNDAAILPGIGSQVGMTIPTTASDQTLIIDIAHDTASTTRAFRRHSAIAEFV